MAKMLTSEDSKFDFRNFSEEYSVERLAQNYELLSVFNFPIFVCNYKGKIIYKNYRAREDYSFLRKGADILATTPDEDRAYFYDPLRYNETRSLIVDVNGKPTHAFVQRVDFGCCHSDSDIFTVSFHKKHGDNPHSEKKLLGLDKTFEHICEALDYCYNREDKLGLVRKALARIDKFCETCVFDIECENTLHCARDIAKNIKSAYEGSFGNISNLQIDISRQLREEAFNIGLFKLNTYVSYMFYCLERMALPFNTSVLFDYMYGQVLMDMKFSYLKDIPYYINFSDRTEMYDCFGDGYFALYFIYKFAQRMGFGFEFSVSDTDKAVLRTVWATSNNEYGHLEANDDGVDTAMKSKCTRRIERM